MHDGIHHLQVRLRQEVPIPLDAELTCGPAELLALVGPSGGGKTTILRCIAGLRRPAHGYVACNGATWLDSERALDVPPQRRSVGFVPQHYALFPHLTAEANVRMALDHRPRSERARRSRELLALVHLTGLEHRRPAELSGGQQQRVALARALARDPAVLLLDEPFSAVDQVTRRKLQRELVQLREQVHIPIILVTHDLDEAVALADRMVVLHHGRSLQSGSPDEVLNRPCNAEVARLVDQRNIFSGEVIEHRPDAGHTLLRWQGHLLETRFAPTLPIGSDVDWLVPAGSIVLHRRDRPSRGEHENPVHGTVTEMLVLGDTAEIVVQVASMNHAGETNLFAFSVPSHVATRNHVTVGERVTMSLLGSGIHLMPASAARR